MYFWKFWQDTRRSVFIYLGALILSGMIWVLRASHIRKFFYLPPASNAALLPSFMPAIIASGSWRAELEITFYVTYMCALVMAFIIGGNGIGADIGKGTGDFLLTRPRSRRYFVWAGWTSGVVELFSVLLFTVLFVFASNWYVLHWQWNLVPSPMHFALGYGKFLDVPLMLATIFLSAGVMYGLTYFFSVVLRNGPRGIVWSLAIVLGYAFIAINLEIYKHISLPGLMLSELASQPIKHWYLAPVTQAIGWTVVALAAPVAAQFALERSDV